MCGNVWEWSLDAYQTDFYANSPRANPLNGGSIEHLLNNYTNVKSNRVLRGGFWGDNSPYVRVAYRSLNSPTTSYFHLGFRCARSVTP